MRSRAFRPGATKSARKPPADPERAARDRLLKLLGTRELSVARARDRLARWEVPQPVAASVLAQLQRERALDDRRAAESFVRAALLRKPAGRVLLLNKLRGFGIDSKLAAEVTAAALTQRDPRADATRLCQSALRRASPRASTEQTQRRLTALLMRRGFDFSLAREVVRQVSPSAKAAQDD